MAIDIASLILDAEIAAKRAGISVNELCALAQVSRATWQRWKVGKTSPSIDDYNRIENAIAHMRSPAAGSSQAGRAA